MKLFFRITFKICLILAILIGCEITEEIKETESDKLLNKGITLLEEGRHDRAIAFFNEALEINPRLADAYYNRVLAYYYKGQYGKAISDYTKAIELSPEYAWAYTGRGWAYETQGQYNKACSDWIWACELGSCEQYELAKIKGDCE